MQLCTVCGATFFRSRTRKPVFVGLPNVFSICITECRSVLEVIRVAVFYIGSWQLKPLLRCTVQFGS